MHRHQLCVGSNLGNTGRCWTVFPEKSDAELPLIKSESHTPFFLTLYQPVQPTAANSAWSNHSTCSCSSRWGQIDNYKDIIWKPAVACPCFMSSLTVCSSLTAQLWTQKYVPVDADMNPSFHIWEKPSLLSRDLCILSTCLPWKLSIKNTENTHRSPVLKYTHT